MYGSELYVIERGEEPQEQRDARRRVMRELMRGRMPSVTDLAVARGLVIRERQESIFSDAWVPLAFIFVIAGFFAGRNVGFLSLGITLLVIYLVSSWWKDSALAGVSYERVFDRTRVFPGEPVQMTVYVNNSKPLPLTWLRFDDRLPVAPVEAGTIAEIISETHGHYVLQTVFSLAGRSSVERRFTFTLPQRGYYAIGPVSYRSSDIFTLFTIQRDHDYTSRLIVYPQVYPLEALALPAKEFFGELRVRRSLFTDPIRTQGIRDYQPQDRFRDVHWKASARRGNLQTKVYDPATSMTLTVFLNVATMRRHWMGLIPEQLERAISVAASICNHAASQKWGVGLYVNGAMPRSDQPIRVPPGHAPDQLGHILEALAATTEFATGSIEKLMVQESPRLPWAASLVLVSAHVGEEIAATLLRLKEAGRRVALITLAEEAPPMLPGIPIYHVPPDAPAFAGNGENSGAPRDPTLTSLASIPVPAPVNGEETDRKDSDGRQ